MHKNMETNEWQLNKLENLKKWQLNEINIIANFHINLEFCLEIF